MITLEIQPRTEDLRLATIRKEGNIPAVLYGKKTPSQSITISLKDFTKVWKTAGESGVITLKGDKGSFDTLIQAVDVDPVTDVVRHADFYVFEKGKKLEVSIPFSYTGVSPAVKDLGGLLVKTLHELKVSADPSHLPHEIVVDISSLATFDSQILASDLVLPKGVDLVENPHEVVVSVSAPKEEEETPSAPVDLSAIEVVKKGKKEEEEVA